jgi:RimJ/RimL family protein N-acetyltransferase
VITLEDWALMRRLAAEGVPKAQIARRLGVSRTTVVKAVASGAPPRYERRSAATSFTPFEARVRALLAEEPELPAVVIAERVGWTGSITWFRQNVKRLRPEHRPVDPADLRSVAEAVEGVPAGVDEVHVDGATVLRWPDHAVSPTFGAVHAYPDRGRLLAEVRPAVERAAGRWGASEVWWWSDQPSLDKALDRAGASTVLTQRVEARDLTSAGFDAWLPADDPQEITVGVVDTWDMAVAMDGVQAAGWRRDPTPPDALPDAWATLEEELSARRAWRLIGSIDGQPAAVGACRLVPIPESVGRASAGTVARLAGAVTLPAYRGRGLYTAIVAARCRIACAHGATLALTHARSETSAPILERLGFVPVNSERCWVLPTARADRADH